VVDRFEPRIRELLRAYPTMPTTVIAERIGWDPGADGGIRRMADVSCCPGTAQ
jgi:hypothetical protein